MWPFDQFIKEWPAIMTAPTIFGFLILAAFAIAFGVVHLFSKREKDALKAENSLKTARVEQLKEETEQMSKRISELEKTPEPSAFNHARYGSTLVKAALFEIEEKKTTRFQGIPAEWTPEQIAKFAAFTGLRDAGAVKIETYGMPPQQTVVTSTNTASDMSGFVRRHEPKPKE